MTNNHTKRPYILASEATDVEHSCCYKNMKEPFHSAEMLELINTIVTTSQGLNFACEYGPIEKESKPYLRSDFDEEWKTKMKETGWESLNPDVFKIPGTGGINPDALLKRNNLRTVIEIEKTKQETIWFDFMKIFAAIKNKISDFGIVIVPKNTMHDDNLFEEARKYLWYLAEFAGVEQALLSKLAIIGYTQIAYIFEDYPDMKKFKELGPCSKKAMKFIKEQYNLINSKR